MPCLTTDQNGSEAWPWVTTSMLTLLPAVNLTVLLLPPAEVVAVELFDPLLHAARSTPDATRRHATFSFFMLGVLPRELIIGWLFCLLAPDETQDMCPLRGSTAVEHGAQV